MSDDTLIFLGDAVKALDDNGRIGALGILFSDGRTKDLANEYFTAKTYLGPSDGDGQECTFDHGFPLTEELAEYADHTFAPVKAKRNKLGIFVETVLNLADDYEKSVFGLARKGKLGWSSGSSGHRVKKDAQTGEIKSWPVSEWALTMRPCQPENYGTALPLKSLGSIKFVPIEDEDDESDVEQKPVAAKSLAAKLTQHINDSVDEKQSRDDLVKHLSREAMMDVSDVERVLTGETPRPSNAQLKAFSRVLDVSFQTLRDIANRAERRTIKGMFAEAMSEISPSRWQLDSAYCDVIRDLAAGAKGTAAAGAEFDYKAPLKEAVKEYMAALEELSIKQVAEYIESDSDEPFYLKAIINLSIDLPVSGGVDIEEHGSLAVSAFKGFVARIRANHEARVKAGRVLSDKNRKVLKVAREGAANMVSIIDKLLDDTMPMASDVQKRAALSSHLRNEWRSKQLGAING